MFQVYFNTAYHGGNYPLSPYEILDYAVYNKELDKVKLIVPTGRLQRRLQMHIASEYFRLYKKPCEYLPVMTFQNFVNEIYEKTFGRGKRQIVSDAYRLSLFEEALEKADMKFFVKPGANASPAVSERLAGVVFGLKEDGVMPEDLEKDLEGSHPADVYVDFTRLADILEIYKSYERLTGGRYLDREDMLNLLSENISPSHALSAYEELFPDREDLKQFSMEEVFPENPAILLGGFSEFKQPELRLISIFAKSDIPFAVHIDYSKENGPLFGNFDDTALKLIKAGFNPLLKEDKTENLDNASYLRRWLFNTEKQIERRELAEMICIIPSKTRETEVGDIARLVKHLIVDEKYEPKDICIAARKPDIYSSLFREIFTESRIPVNISDRFPLAKSPAAIAVFSLLNMITGGYRRDDVIRALQSKYLDFGNSNSGINSENLYETALKMKISGGWKQGADKGWKRRLEAAVNFSSKRLYDLEKENSIEESELLSEKQRKDTTEKALSDFITLCSMIDFKNGNYSPSEFSEIIKKSILQRFKVKEKILYMYDNLHKNGSVEKDELNIYLEEIERDASAFSELVKLTEELDFVLSDRFPGKKFSLEDLVNRLKTTVSGAKYQIREKIGCGVTVTSVEQTREIPYKVTILCGAVDGEFPSVYRPETFLGKELPETEERHIRAERLLFYQFLTNNPELFNAGKKKIFITYPEQSLMGDFVPSPFINSLCKIISENRDNLTIKEENYGWREALISKNEILGAYGANKVNGSDSDNDILIRNLNLSSEELAFINNIIENKRDYSTAEINSDAEYEKGSSFFDYYDKKPYSASDIELYASCPFKFYTEKILKTKAPEEIDFLLSPLDRGSLLHNVFFLFYRKVQELQLQNGEPAVYSMPRSRELPPLASVRLSDKNAGDYSRLLHEIARKEIDKYRFENPFFMVEEDDIFGGNGKKGVLQKWLDEEIALFEGGYPYSPALFELNFGSYGRVKTEGSLPPQQLRDNFILRGKIDRLEVGEDNSFIIADYKTNIQYQAGNSEVKNLKAFQLPLYAAAAEKILKEHYAFEPDYHSCVYISLNPARNDKGQTESRKYLLLKRETDFGEEFDKRKTAQILKKEDSAPEILETIVEKAVDIKQSIAEGEFPVEPESNNCKNCRLQSFCRILEIDREEKENTDNE